MLFVPLWLCTIPAVLSLRCRLFAQNNRPIYECINISTASGSVASRGVTLPTVPPGTMTFKIVNARVETLESVGNPEIVTFMMNDCRLSAVSTNAFALSTNLKQIDLSHNLLTHSSFDAFKYHNHSPPLHQHIERLILSYNRFEVIPNLSALNALRDLDLSHNQIIRIPDASLLLPKLEWIDLSYNSLTNVRKWQFSNRIRFIELHENPWNCDCALRDFVAFQRETLISRSLRCKQPPPLHGIKWDDLELSDFTCGPEISAPLHEVISASRGELIQMNCEVVGDPIPNVSWITNQSNAPLKWNINEVSAEDENTYWCIARAGYGMMRKRFDLTLSSNDIKLPSDADFRDLINENVEFTSLVDDETDGHMSVLSADENADDGTRNVWMKNDDSDIMLKILLGGHPFLMVILLTVIVLACALLLSFCAFVYRMHTTSRRNHMLPERKCFIANERNLLVQDQNVTTKITTSSSNKCGSSPPLVIINHTDNGIQSGLNNSTLSVQKPITDSNHYDDNSSEGMQLDRCHLDEWTPKAPLAQYDRDTSVLPIVQTSL
ncbi:unnamed protein product [Anisakis simplex]|uniref:Ig-like domain-containing protein n=1 Tax=Anisakis simplex TaxID=6269 RepID=A0A0M3JZS5_ANISI|nr:unnamed protein product [Anisakis simplex]